MRRGAGLVPADDGVPHPAQARQQLQVVRRAQRRPLPRAPARQRAHHRHDDALEDLTRADYADLTVTLAERIEPALIAADPHHAEPGQPLPTVDDRLASVGDAT